MNQSNPYYERNYICPICEVQFSSLSIRNSAIYVEKRETDFHNIYRGISPLHYVIAVCPQCNYAASQKSFAEKLPAAIVAQFKHALAILDTKDINFTKERDLNTALESLHLAIRTAQLKKSSYGGLAGLLHSAAWICREDGNVKMERTYLEQACESYQKGYQESTANIGNLTDVQVSYLIGELSLRLGRYNEAIRWFNLTINNPNIKLNRNLEIQTRDQWSLAREIGKKQSAADA